MNVKQLLLGICAGLICGASYAQKSVYIPQEWRNRTDTLIWAEEDPNNEYTWSLSRSKETDNVIILWDKGWGSTSPSDAASPYHVDIDDLAEKCEVFYQLECDSLGFVDPETSNLSKYKVMVLMNHTTTWTCYGGGYDYQVPALWLNPSTCQPVGSAVAHEVGHSFHYMCYAEDSDHGTNSSIQTGFHGAVGNGATIWETTANWQALQSYPNEMFTESYHYDIFDKSHNLAFSHEWHRYAAYMFLYYLNDYYGDIKTVANVWNHRVTSVKDFNQVLMDYKNLTAAELYRLHFDFAMHAVTWDLDVWKTYRSSYVGNYEYYCVKDGTQSYQVAYASAPQSSGFNVIPLQVPAAGTEIKVKLTGLKSKSSLLVGDPGLYLDGNTQWAEIGQDYYNATSAMRNFYAGFVVLKTNGDREYFTADTLLCHGKAEKTDSLSMVLPSGVSKLWMVVAPSPGTYVQHKWDEDPTNDDQWPYKFQITGTDIDDEVATVYESYQFGDRAIGDITLQYDLYMPYANGTTQTVTIDGDGLIALGTALQMEGDEIAALMEPYSEEGPTAGHIMLYPYDAGGLIESDHTATEEYGYWFTQFGVLTSEGQSSARVKAVFDPSDLTIDITNETSLSTSRTPSVRLALRYKSTDGSEAIARFNIVLHNSTTTRYTLSSTTYDEEAATGIEGVNSSTDESETSYDLSGRILNSRTKGLHVAKRRKYIVK